MATPLLGWISPVHRTAAQHDADALAKASIGVRFTLPAPRLVRGQAVRLFDAWKAPEVVADVGFAFNRIHQQTGSCVWAGGTNGLFSSIAMQRVAGQNRTKAFLPFTLGNYAMSRHYSGDDGQGEGSLGSTFWKSLSTDGVRDWPQPAPSGMPNWKQADGIAVTAADEMKWSSYRNSDLQAVLAVSKPHTIAATGECQSIDDIRAMLGNGYGVSFACDNYINSGSIAPGGGTPYVKGRWDRRGGHQQSLHAYWEHPNDGPLYWAQNNWPADTYPTDPAGGPVCGVWVVESDVQAAMRLNAEIYGLSHLAWFPAAPDVLDWTP